MGHIWFLGGFSSMRASDDHEGVGRIPVRAKKKWSRPYGPLILSKEKKKQQKNNNKPGMSKRAICCRI